MDIESWRIFVMLERLRSFSATAQALHLSQSTVSQRLQNLEADLGVALWVRGKELSLTEAGAALLPRAKALLAAEQRARSAAQRFVTDVSGTVKIAASQTSGGYILPPLLCDFARRHPDVTLKLNITNSENVVQTVAEGEADFGVVESPTSHPRLTEYGFVEDLLYLVTSSGHPLAAKPHLTRADLMGSLLALREPGSGTRSTLSVAWPVPLEKDFRLLELGSQAAVRTSIRTGLAVGFLSQWVVAEDVAAGLCVLKTVEGVVPVRTMRLVKRREAFSSKAGSELFQALKKAGRTLKRPESLLPS